MSSEPAIPIANIYYLLCYAWNQLNERDHVSVAAIDSTTLQELFARLLESGVSRLLKRGLSRTYVERQEEIAGVRGRIDIGASVKRTTFARAAAVCQFDESSSDSIQNRILKSTLRSLARVEGLDHTLATRLRELYRRFVDVTEIRLNEHCFTLASRERNRGGYGMLLDVCGLVYRNLLVDEVSGQVKFRDFTRDDAQMAALFEQFLLRFYSVEQRQYDVGARRIRWQSDGSPEDVAYLPVMRTDICLFDANSTIVIDAKYFRETLAERFGKETIRSGHLYQLFAYMHHLALETHRPRVCGLLLYPRTSRSVRLAVELSGFQVQVVAIDFTQHWRAISDELLAAVGQPREEPSSNDGERRRNGSAAGSSATRSFTSVV